MTPAEWKGTQTWLNIKLAYYWCSALGQYSYYQGHWIFTWRYFLMSQLLSSVKHADITYNKKLLNGISGTMSLVIFGNSLTNAVITRNPNSIN